MSTNLYWMPKMQERDRKFPDALKHALRKRFGWPMDRGFDRNDSEYVLGLAHAEIVGAQELYDAIERYGEVRLWEAE